MKETSEEKKKRTEELFWSVEQLVSSQLSRAIEKHGHFSSDHEGYAMLKEEHEESKEALEMAESMLEYGTVIEECPEKDGTMVSKEYSSLWESVKNDNEKGVMRAADHIYYDMIHVAMEAIQAAAVCGKIIISQEARNE